MKVDTPKIANTTPAPETHKHKLGSLIQSVTLSSHRQVLREVEDSVSFLHNEDPVGGELLDLPADIHPLLGSALNSIGVKQLFSHQIQGLQALREGKDIAPATPTASGKTLTFNVGVFESLLNNPASSALYLFPLKALAVDQVGKLEEIAAGLPSNQRIKIATMTGDVSPNDRLRMFKYDYPRIVAASPDVLHHQIYKIKKDEWEQWRLFLKNLKFIVVDEAHTYVSVFGANFANLLRRLLLAIDSCGGDSSQVQFVFATATVGNIREMVSKFSGRYGGDVEVIDHSGAGSKGRTIVCLKPPAEPLIDASDIAQLWLKYGLTGIVFVNSRREAKQLHAMLRKDLGRASSQVAVYYGGLREKERNEIVAGIRSSRIKIVISTSALEAGIDLPALDACLCCGFAGSLMSHRQRIGRAGRKNPGLLMFLPYDDRPLDAYYNAKPEELLFGSAENVAFNATYESILHGHLLCAAAESGIPQDEVVKYFGDNAKSAISKLLNKRELRVQNDRFVAYGYPHREVNLRGSSADTVSVYGEDEELIEEMDLATAFKEVFSGAVYGAYSNGQIQRYFCHHLDVKGRKAILHRCYDDGISTSALSKTTIKQTEKRDQKVIDTVVDSGRFRLTLGWGRISRIVLGYRVKERQNVFTCMTRSCQNLMVEIEKSVCPVCGQSARSHEVNKVIDTVMFDEPLAVHHEAPMLKIEINPAFQSAVAGKVEELKQEINVKFPDFDYPREVEPLWKSSPEFISIHSLAHHLSVALPRLVLASPFDVDAFVVEGDEDAEGKLCTTIGYLFDTVDGGSGATEEIFRRFNEFVEKGKEIAETCTCEHGCPKCLYVSNCSQFNVGLNKGVGLFTLNSLGGFSGELA